MEGMNLSSAVQAFATAKPWSKMKKESTLVIGIQGLADKTAYAVVTGKDNGYTLALCMDSFALSCYAALLYAKSNQANDAEIAALMLEQNYLECRLEGTADAPLNQFIQPFGLSVPYIPGNSVLLRRHTPARLPDLMVTKEEIHQICVALFAASEFGNMDASVREKLGMHEAGWIPCATWTADNKFEWKKMNMMADSDLEFSSPLIQDEVSIHRLKKLPQTESKLICAVRILPMPVSENPVTFPWLMVMIDGMNQVVGTPIVSEYDTEYSAFVGEVLSYMEECGRPACIETVDPRTYSLLKGIGEQLNIPIYQIEDAPQVVHTLEAFIDYMRESVVQSTQTPPKKSSTCSKQKRPNGICRECYQEFSASEMTEHVLACSARQFDEEGEDNFLIRISVLDDPNYWMYVELKKDAYLSQLDNFIRSEWVECCGHMSMFRIQGEEYLSSCAGMSEVQGMKRQLAKLVEVGSEFDYEYDFGSPTCLHLEVIGECRVKKRRNKVRLTAQNIRPKYDCIRCGKQAEWVFRPNLESIEEGVFCDKCAQNEENAPFMLPLLNSPRAGVCGFGQWMLDEE